MEGDMWISREGKSFLIVMVMLFSQTTLHSSQHTSLNVDNFCRRQEVKFRLNEAIHFVNRAMESLEAMESKSCPPKPDDCNALYKCGQTSSGIYLIWPKSRIVDNPIQVYCDMETDGGGWTVIQRRGDFGKPDDFFYREWKDYKEGFGDRSEDFWLGNDNIGALSNQKNYSIRFDLRDHTGEQRWATYDHFWIDSEFCNYTLHVSGYNGDAGDSFSYHSGFPFTTKDRDNDQRPFNCAVVCRGAWWYKACFQSNLNALYLNGNHPDRRYQGINWVKWHYDNYSLPFTEMKIRPLSSDEENSGQHCMPKA